MSQALRRHHRERLKAKRRFYHTRPGSIYRQNSDSVISFYVDTPCPCSCDGCGNPRRSKWSRSNERLTMQERRFLCVSEDE